MSADDDCTPVERPLWSLHEDVVVEGTWNRSRAPVLRGVWGPVRVPDAGTTAREALDRMSLGPVSLENVAGLAESYRAWRRGTGDCTPWKRIRRILDLLGGRVVPSLGAEDGLGPQLSLVAERERVRFRVPALHRDVPVRLARGVRLVVHGGLPTLVRPGAPFRVLLLRDRAADLARSVIDEPATVVELAAEAEAAEPDVRDTVAYLAGAGLVERQPEPAADGPHGGAFTRS